MEPPENTAQAAKENGCVHMSCMGQVFPFWFVALTSPSKAGHPVYPHTPIPCAAGLSLSDHYVSTPGFKQLEGAHHSVHQVTASLGLGRDILCCHKITFSPCLGWFLCM